MEVAAPPPPQCLPLLLAFTSVLVHISQGAVLNSTSVRSISTTKGTDAQIANIMDGSNSGWVSYGICRLGNYRSDEPTQNLLLGACAAGRCSSSGAHGICTCADTDDQGDPTCSSPTLAEATDASVYTAATIRANGTTTSGSGCAHYFWVGLPRPQTLDSVYVRGSMREFTRLLATTVSGEELVLVADLALSFAAAGGSEATLPLSAAFKAKVIASLRVEVACTDSPDANYFQVTEIAAYGSPCFDAITVELTSAQLVADVVVNLYSSNVQDVAIQASLDGLNYQEMGRLIPDGSWKIEQTVSFGTSGADARFVRILAFNTLKITFRELTISTNDEERGSGTGSECFNSCSGHGSCSSSAASGSSTAGSNPACTCDQGWAGSDCSWRACDGGCGAAENVCLNGTCVCGGGNGSYFGAACAEQLPCPMGCHSSSEAGAPAAGQQQQQQQQQQGVCVRSASHPPRCTCLGSFFGSDCVCERNRPLGYGLDILSQGSSVTVTTNDRSDPTKLGLIVDGATSPLWSSFGACRAGAAYVTEALGRLEQNALLGACAMGRCTSSCECPQSRANRAEKYDFYSCSSHVANRVWDSWAPQEQTYAASANISPIDGATDADGYTAAHIRRSDATGRSWFNAALPTPQQLKSIFLKAALNKNARVAITAVTETGERVVLGGGNTSMPSGDAITLDVPASAGIIVAIHLEVTVTTLAAGAGAGLGKCYGGEGECADFVVSEIAAIPLATPCHDDVTVDLGAIMNVSVVKLDMYKNDVQSVVLSTSLDNATFATAVASVPFNADFWRIDYAHQFKPVPLAARYIRIAAITAFKISVNEITVWGKPLGTAALSSNQCWNSCSGHGECNEAGQCACTTGFLGQDCSVAACEPSCGAHGTCANGRCVCAPYWYGTSCEKPSSCPNDCWGHGQCTQGACICAQGFDGLDCRYRLETVEGASLRVLHLDDYMAPVWQPRHPHHEQDLANSAEAGCLTAQKPFPCPAGAAAGACGVSLGACALPASSPGRFPPASAAGAVSVNAWAQTANAGSKVLTPLAVSSVSASSTSPWGDYGAPKAADGDRSTYWRSESSTEARWHNVTLDLGQVANIGAIRVDGYVGGNSGDAIDESVVEYSVDGASWEAAGAVANMWNGIEIDVTPPVPARYVRVARHLRATSAAATWVTLREVLVWGDDGPFGPFAAALPNPLSFRRLLGVNGIWGWGTSAYSHSHREGWGPFNYGGSPGTPTMATHGRNYHNWHWDSVDPDETPDFVGMACKRGTKAQWWLDWNREYRAWKKAGLEVQTSIQFTRANFPTSLWNDPYRAAYRYGYAFASAFGPSHGSGDVLTMEVGNEPDYEVSMYSDILLGMARGAKAADPAMRVLPGVVVGVPWSDYINSTHVEVIDGLNTHLYSWTSTAKGRTGVHPESKVSIMHEILGQLRFRDANMPGLPLYVSEWGWDSAGGDESCEMPECVSEHSQAVYAIRSTLLFARLGVARLSWFFYANLAPEKSNTVFSRSGLTGSSATGFKPKQSLRAFEELVKALGNHTFHGVVREDHEAYAYLLANGDGVVSHLVAWRPVDGDDSATRQVALDMSSLSPGNLVAARAWHLTGLKSGDVSPLSTYVMDATTGTTGSWTATVSAAPLVVELAAAGTAVPPPCTTSCSGHGICRSETCVCDTGFFGANCAKKECSNGCWNHGTCDYATGICGCESWITASAGVASSKTNRSDVDAVKSSPSWVFWDPASSCQYPACPLECSQHGLCVKGSCDCDSAFAGKHCQLAACPYRLGRDALFDCRSHGLCVEGKCQCRDGTEGEDCHWSHHAPAVSSSGAATGTQDTVAPVVVSGQELVENHTQMLPALDIVGVEVSSNPGSASKITDQPTRTTSPWSVSAWRSGTEAVFLIDGQRAEFATVDLGSAVPIGSVSLQCYLYAPDTNADTVQKTLWQFSNDSTATTTWTTFNVNEPASAHTVDVAVDPPVAARYVRIVHVMKNGVTNAIAQVWGIVVYGAAGPFGAIATRARPPPASRQTFGALLGVNGIWGWGTGAYSDDPELNRAAVYGGEPGSTPIFTHGRNYHNWHWDESDPDRPPRFGEMATAGHDGKLRHAWLNWDREYTAWNAAGMEVQASIQFVSEDFPSRIWNDPYRAAYRYGYAFAEHFGPTYGSGDVLTMEVGNEPDYEVSMYSDILLGMARGAKAADPAMRVLPGVVVGVPWSDYINSTHVEVIDGLNTHLYSWTSTAKGRTGVHPESKVSIMHEILGQLRFRDANMPGLPLYVSEWGWDSAGGDESCEMPECVSEHSQAVYAIRSTLLFARLGVARLSWFFYANLAPEKSNTVFSRSGLTGSSATGFKPKQSLRAFEELVTTLGNHTFHDIVREDHEAYAYVLANANGVVSHLVAWRPVDGDDTATRQVVLDVSSSLGTSAAAARAWRLTGLKSGDVSPLSTHVTAGTGNAAGTWTVTVGAAPLLIEVAAAAGTVVPANGGRRRLTADTDSGSSATADESIIAEVFLSSLSAADFNDPKIVHALATGISSGIFGTLPNGGSSLSTTVVKFCPASLAGFGDGVTMVVEVGVTASTMVITRLKLELCMLDVADSAPRLRFTEAIKNALRSGVATASVDPAAVSAVVTGRPAKRGASLGDAGNCSGSSHVTVFAGTGSGTGVHTLNNATQSNISSLAIIAVATATVATAMSTCQSVAACEASRRRFAWTCTSEHLQLSPPCNRTASAATVPTEASP